MSLVSATYWLDGLSPHTALWSSLSVAQPLLFSSLTLSLLLGTKQNLHLPVGQRTVVSLTTPANVRMLPGSALFPQKIRASVVTVSVFTSSESAQLTKRKMLQYVLNKFYISHSAKC